MPPPLASHSAPARRTNPAAGGHTRNLTVLDALSITAACGGSRGIAESNCLRRILREGTR